jgi:hypothetical protein
VGSDAQREQEPGLRVVKFNIPGNGSAKKR